MFSVKGDHVPKHNVPWSPVLDPVWSVFFYAGILAAVLALRRMRSGRGRQELAWLAWLFFMSLPSVVSKTDSANMLRNLGVTPAVAYFVASGWWWGMDGVRRLPRKWWRWGHVVVIVALLWGAGFQVYKLWVRHPKAPGIEREFSIMHVELARMCQADPRGALLFVPTDFYTHKTFEFLTIGRKDIRPLDPVALLSRPEQGPAVDHRVLCTALSPNYQLLVARFPDGVLEPGSLQLGGTPFAWIFRIPSGLLLAPEQARKEAETLREKGFIIER
jgi:hypothetical protein